MTQKVTTMEVRQRLGDILNRVSLRHDEFIVERKGKPIAAVVPVERQEQMRESARSFMKEFMARPRKPIAQEEADRLANEAKHESRKVRQKPRRR